MWKEFFAFLAEPGLLEDQKVSKVRIDISKLVICVFSNNSGKLSSDTSSYSANETWRKYG
jgi:hypothetical protein